MQVDYTSAFLHASIDEDVPFKIPRRFKQPGQVLKLNYSLYGLKQSSWYFFLYLKGKLENLKFTQSDVDACLFVCSDIICFVYVNDCPFLFPSDCKFDSMLNKLRKFHLYLEKEKR